MEMDWIHCNYCFIQCKPDILLFLTSCGHMFCQTCLGEGAKGGQCKICHSTCSAVKLTNKMPPDVQEYFIQPEDLIKKTASILDFQRRHRMRLTNHWTIVAKKLLVRNEEVKRLNELCHKLNDAVRKLRGKNQDLKMQLAERQRSSSNDGLSPFPQMHSPNAISPTLSQRSVQRPAKSTPYQDFQSHLVTPAKVLKQRHRGENNKVNVAQDKRNVNRMMYLSPSPPSSAGSGYYSLSPLEDQTSPNLRGTVLATVRRSDFMM